MSARSVCSNAGAVVTITSSDTLPGATSKSTRVDELISTSIFWCVSFLKPCATTVTVYVPGGRLGIVKLPASFVTDSYTVEVAAFVHVTFALATVAPVESDTVPSSVPLTACPNDVTGNANRHTTTQKRSSLRFITLNLQKKNRV